MSLSNLKSAGYLSLLMPLAFFTGWERARSLPTLSPGMTQESQELLDTLEFVEVPDGFGGTVTHLVLSGVNVQVVNGLSATNGNPQSPGSVQVTSSNGLGNVLVGYAENLGPQVRTGSHMLVVGRAHSWQNFGGVVAGERNGSAASYGSAVGGTRSGTTGIDACTMGGRGCAAQGEVGLTLSGEQSQAVSSWSMVLAGGAADSGGSAEAPLALVLGGLQSEVTEAQAVVAGGIMNRSDAASAVVLGGEENSIAATGFGAALFGGQGRVLDEELAVEADGTSGGVSDDGDWEVDAFMLTTDARRVAIGSEPPQHPMSVAPSVDASQAAVVEGDVHLGGSGPATATLRGEQSSWILGPDAVGLFDASLSGGLPVLQLDEGSDLFLGQGEWEGALRIAARETSELLLQGGVFGDGARALLQCIQGASLRGGVGFLDGGRRLSMQVNGTAGAAYVHADRYTKSTQLGRELTALGDSQHNGTFVVQNQAVLDDAVFGGGGDSDEGFRLRNSIRPLAWGEVDVDGSKIRGSDNWTSRDLYSQTIYGIAIDDTDYSTALVGFAALNMGPISNSSFMPASEAPWAEWQEDNEWAFVFSDPGHLDVLGRRFTFLILEITN